MRFTTGALVGLASITRVLADGYGYNPVEVDKDSKHVAKNFKDVKGVKLVSPAFTTPSTIPDGFQNGTQGPTSDAQMTYFMQTIASRNDWVTYDVLDIKSEEGRTMPYVYLSTSSQTDGTNATAEKVRVWIQGGVHGNEPAGDQSLLALLGKMDADPTYAATLLEKLDIFMLPRYNPDGVSYFQRTLATNFDPNRDHVKLARKFTRGIKSAFSAFSPHVAVDMHEYSAAPIYGGQYQHAADALYSAAKNLNIHPSIRELSEDLFAANVATALEDQGLRWEPYVTGSSSDEISTIYFDEAGSDAKIGRNGMGLSQCITFLCETRGIYLADQQFQRRTVAALTMVEAIVQTAASNAESVLSTMNTAIESFSSSTEDIIVTDYTKYEDRDFSMVDTNNGSVVQVPIQFASTTPVTANLTRTRPEAYLIPAAWADLAERLEVSGVEVQTLTQTYRGVVEVLEIDSAVLDAESGYYEGAVLVTATTTPKEKEVVLPPGSFWVSTHQKNAALAFVALEPENIDSYVSFNIIPVFAGDEYPVFRVL